jgi:hypothetical protein
MIIAALFVSTCRRTKSGAQFQKISAGFEIRMRATDRNKKYDIFESLIRKKLPRAKLVRAYAMAIATDHSGVHRVPEFDRR